MALVLPMRPIAAQEKQTDIAIVGFVPTVGAIEKDVIEGLETYLKGRQDVGLTPTSDVKSFITQHELKRTTAMRLRIKQAEELYKKGRKEYDQLKLDAAVATFRKALVTFEEVLPYLEKNRYLLSTHLYLGMCLLLQKKKKEGRAEIRQMVLLDLQREKRKLSSKFFSPDVIKNYESIKRDVMKDTAAQLVVVANVDGARVYLDGRRLAGAPLKLSKLAEGEHRITVFRRGYERLTKIVQLKKGMNRINFELVRSVPFRVVESNPMLSGGERPIFSEAKSRIAANVFILANAQPLSNKGLLIKAQLYSTRSGEFSEVVEIEIDDESKAKQRGFRLGKQLLSNLNDQGDVLPVVWGKSKSQEILTTVEKDSEPVASELSDQFTALPTGDFDPNQRQKMSDYRGSFVSEKKPFYKKWWFWTIVGGAAVAGGGYFFIANSGSGSNDNVLVINNPGFD